VEGIVCPKPMLHPDALKEGVVRGTFDLEACLFCNRWYMSMDVVLTSCKHCYHPFCISKLAETTYRCVTCDEVFHPNLWASFGFWHCDSKLSKEKPKFSLKKLREELVQCLKEKMGFLILGCKFMIITFILFIAVLCKGAYIPKLCLKSSALVNLKLLL
jgi:hypothetical protein